MSIKTILYSGGCILLLAVTVLFISACREAKSVEERGNVPKELIIQLKQGDLALRRGRDVASYMLSQANVADKRYSHCGLVQIEQGYPFVYHFINGQSRQGLVRDSAELFFSPKQNSLAAAMRYELTDEEKEAQTSLIWQYYNKESGFDMRFDARTEDKLYCSEFVYRVMNGLKEDSTFIKPVTRKGFDYVPVDRLYADGKTVAVWQMSFK